MPKIIDSPTLDVSEFLIGDSEAQESQLKDAANLYLKNGMLALRNAIKPELVESLNNEFFFKYQKYFENKDHEDALKTGNKRFMVTVELAGPFNDTGFYAHDKIIPLIQYLLGRKAILNSVGAVIALPNAKLQHLHQDGTIFDPYDNPNFVRHVPLLPPFAITLVIPLVPLDHINGTTRIFPGTHLFPSSLATSLDVDTLPACEPHTLLGDCYLMDYRVFHQGLPNHSSQIRPIMYNIYTCPWYRDYQNFERQKRLVISESELDNVPENSRHLLNWITDPSHNS
jgi:ectoine hydroxylase-related dioxygenase (phytanoyl-CoA dioxygenase family)